MTEESSKHPMRCETCGNLQKSQKGMSPDCSKLNHWLTDGDRKLTACVGCFSHTSITKHDAAIAQAAREDEREKVLEEAVDAIQKRIDGIFEAYRGETDEKITRFPFTMANGMGEAQKIVKSLMSAPVKTGPKKDGA